MKAVLISIQPKWCEMIASGKKTIEVRKTRPKIETPFKCYIYCTEGKDTVYYMAKIGLCETRYDGKVTLDSKDKLVCPKCKRTHYIDAEFVDWKKANESRNTH